MHTIWIGDSRSKTLYQSLLSTTQAENEKQEEQEKQNSDSETNSNKKLNTYEYFFSDHANYSWFVTKGCSQLDEHVHLETTNLENSQLVVMLGLYDCILSSMWETINVQNIAMQYAEKINELLDKYSNISFYVCTVLPITGDYSNANSPDGVITKEHINEKIVLFNESIKNNCKANIIDIYDYAVQTGFSTYDGLHYTQKTAECLYNYITYNYTSITSLFAARLEAPTKPDESGNGGDAHYFSNENVFFASGWGMPNCTAYAWGRFYEILGERPTLNTGNAEQWFPYTSDGYDRGEEPKLGAIICWSHISRGGHVGIVEEIHDDGSITTSESGYNAYFWRLRNRQKGDGNWGAGSDYSFQGFIYNPKVTNSVVNDFVTKSQVIAENRYLSRSEMQINARYIWQYLGSRGWTLNAVSGMLGNMEHESTISPNRFEVIKGASIGKTPTEAEIGAYFEKYKSLNTYYRTPDASGSYGRYPGCGLTGWTFADYGREKEWRDNKLIRWCLDRKIPFNEIFYDIDHSLERLLWECEHEKQWVTSGSNYKISFKDFSKSLKDPYWLAGAFLDNYENPANPNFEQRGKAAEKWYKFLMQYSPWSAQEPVVYNLKTDMVLPTQVTTSVVVRNCQAGKYTLAYADGTIITENKELFKIEKTPDTGDTTANQNMVFTFEHKNLIPNTKYLLKVSADTVGDNAEQLESSIYFTTPQDFPDPVTNLVLINTNGKIPSSSIILNSNNNTYWGFWKEHGKNFGYRISLIVNGQVVEEKNISILPSTLNIFDNFTFKNYKCNLGDNIQVGIRTFVIDSSSKLIYNKGYMTVSNAICFLDKTLLLYLKDVKS